VIAARRDTARLAGALALALSFTPSLMRRSRRDQLLVSAASAVLGALAGAGTEVVVVRLANRLEGGEGTARGALVAAGVVATLAELPADRRSAVALAGTATRVAGICALVGAVAPVRRNDPLQDPRAVGAAALVAAAAFAGWRALERHGRPPRPRLTEWPDARYLPTVSFGPGSLIERETLDFEASRFLAGAVAGLPRDPIRVFVGLRSAPTVEQRCDLAVRELDRLGAFERGRVVVVAATLRGFVNPIIPAAEEHFSGGDVATVVVQYHDRPTVLMPAKVPIAARTHRELLARLARRGGGAEVVVYGESLGAWASQNVFRRGGVAALDGLGVARALWIGTPYFSRLRRAFERRRLPADERLASVRVRDLVRGDPPDARRLRFVLLYRATDPVVLFPGLELLWRRPDWLPAGRWRPGITFVQTVADLMNATRWTSGLPQALAHDYRMEGPLAVRLAFGHHDVPREQASRVADRLVAQEVENGARLRAARRALR